MEKEKPVYYIHGENRSNSKEYEIWANIIQRCHNPNNPRYRDWGGRGIRMCWLWRMSYILFLEYVGRRPSSNYTLGRINNNKGYEPGNVEWQTRTRQGRDTRRVRLTLAIARKIRSQRDKLSLEQLASIYGVSKSCINHVMQNRSWR